MTFALLHATLGWGFAFLACLAFRRRAAAARCWAWRLGLLKGPLALLLSVPVVVAAPAVMATSPIQEAPYRSHRTYKTHTSYREPFDPLPWAYGAGVLAVALSRLTAARRVHRAMPRVEGVLRPRVVVPDGLSREDAAMARAHEAAHVRRRDPQWSFVADLCCAALWFAPPVWLCARAMRAEAEASCDADALRETGAAKLEYARLLLAFASPAPANALGGPARRLARRILMLERKAKPLPRPAWGLLALVGLATTLPWQAVAVPSFAEGAVAERLPARISLASAALRLLRDPDVRAELRLTPAQEATLELRVLKGNLRLLAMRKRDAVSNLRKFPTGSREPMAQATRVELENVTRDEADIRRRIEGTRAAPLSEGQRRRLAAFALDRFGSALWEDPAVAGTLGLNPDQLAAVKAQNDTIEAALREDRSAGEFANIVAARRSEIRRGGLTPARKAALEREIQAMRHLADATRRASQEESPRFWRMRGAADARLEGGLAPEQRRRLQELKSAPEAWPSAPALPMAGP